MSPITQAQLLASLEATFHKCLEIAKIKNADYTGERDAFYNFELVEQVLGVPTEKGLLVRMLDKISRLNTLLDREAEVKDEKIEDTLLDLCNYAALLKAYIELKGKN